MREAVGRAVAEGARPLDPQPPGDRTVVAAAWGAGVALPQGSFGSVGWSAQQAAQVALVAARAASPRVVERAAVMAWTHTQRGEDAAGAIEAWAEQAWFWEALLAVQKDPQTAFAYPFTFGADPGHALASAVAALAQRAAAGRRPALEAGLIDALWQGVEPCSMQARVALATSWAQGGVWPSWADPAQDETQFWAYLEGWFWKKSPLLIDAITRDAWLAQAQRVVRVHWRAHRCNDRWPRGGPSGAVRL